MKKAQRLWGRLEKNSVVKKSIINTFLNMLLPYYCRGCGKTGDLLCEECRRDLDGNSRVVVKNVGQRKVGEMSVGGRKKIIELGEVEVLFVGGVREGILKRLVEDYKFKSVKDIAEILTDILDRALPKGIDVVVVPLPTIRKHIRMRGFDHTKRLAEELGKKRGWTVSEVLRRVNKTVQVGSDEKTREQQAARAYEVDATKLELDKTYLLLDDVWTTGSSMRAAAEKMHKAGMKRVMGCVVEISLNPESGQ